MTKEKIIDATEFEDMQEDLDFVQPHCKLEVNLQNVIAGQWLRESNPDGSDSNIYRCSICGRAIQLDPLIETLVDYPYCHCGAKMGGE